MILIEANLHVVAVVMHEGHGVILRVRSHTAHGQITLALVFQELYEPSHAARFWRDFVEHEIICAGIWQFVAARTLLPSMVSRRVRIAVTNSPVSSAALKTGTGQSGGIGMATWVSSRCSVVIGASVLPKATDE